MKRYIHKKPLPRVINTTKPTRSFILELLEEESFDCLRTEIENNTGPEIQNDQQRRDKKRAAKATRRYERERLRAVLVEKYGAGVFARFNSKKKRKAVRDDLSGVEAHALKYWSNQLKEKARRKRRRADKGKRSTYDTYINSKAWERRRNLYWQTHARRCAVCDTPKLIHLHHMSYEKLKQEPDEHLIALCQAHHKGYHDENGVQRHMIRKTLSYVEREAAKLTTNH